MKEKVQVSACLCGIICRWHGRKARSGTAARQIAEGNYEAVLFCPEMAAGQPCPRPPVKRRKGHVYETCAEKEHREEVTGRELTTEFQHGAELALQKCQELGIKKAIQCSYSPSCDKNGFAGKLLKANGIEVINVF